VAADDPRFVPWEYSYPRGTAWMSFGNWLTYHALRRAGLDAAAHALALRTLRTTCDCPRPSIYEHYNPLTGAGHGYAMFGWTSAVLIDLIRREYGVDFTDAGEWIFSAPLTPTNYEFSVTVRGRQVRTVGAAGRTVVTIDGKQVATLECGNRCILDDQFAIRDTRSLRLPA
jgi:hypothetical protein